MTDWEDRVEKGWEFLARRLAVGIVLGGVAAMLLPWAWQQWVHQRYDASIVSVDSAPAGRVALVFGARVYRSGRLSAMLYDRVETAAALYHAGKVDSLIMSGGHNGDGYDEPEAMAARAVAAGVPSHAIRLDYGGLRTYDTCYRAVHVFDLTSALLVTQAFHLPRALLLCNGLGLDAVGVAADRRPYSPRSLAWSELREMPALTAALFDLIRRAPPAILDR